MHKLHDVRIDWRESSVRRYVSGASFAVVFRLESGFERVEGFGAARAFVTQARVHFRELVHLTLRLFVLFLKRGVRALSRVVLSL